MSPMARAISESGDSRDPIYFRVHWADCPCFCAEHAESAVWGSGREQVERGEIPADSHGETFIAGNIYWVCPSEQEIQSRLEAGW